MGIDFCGALFCGCIYTCAGICTAVKSSYPVEVLLSIMQTL